MSEALSVTTLLQPNNGGDRARVNALLDESLAYSSELRMRPLMLFLVESRPAIAHTYALIGQISPCLCNGS